MKRYDYTIAIPSYQRPEAIQKKTLATLARAGINIGAVDVWVANSTEADAYQGAGVEANTLVGAPGIKNARNAMVNHYVAGQRIVYLDDDIEEIIVRVSEKIAHPITSFDEEVLQPAWEACERSGAKLWGVYPVPNPFFMKEEMTFDLRFCCGALHGTINDRAVMGVELEEKEDFERTIKSFISTGAVVRLNHISYKQKPYKNAGGCQDPERANRSARAAAELARRFPGYVSPAQAKNGHAQVRLKR